MHMQQKSTKQRDESGKTLDRSTTKKTTTASPVSRDRKPVPEDEAGPHVLDLVEGSEPERSAGNPVELRPRADSYSCKKGVPWMGWRSRDRSYRPACRRGRGRAGARSSATALTPLWCTCRGSCRSEHTARPPVRNSEKRPTMHRDISNGRLWIRSERLTARSTSSFDGRSRTCPRAPFDERSQFRVGPLEFSRYAETPAQQALRVCLKFSSLGVCSSSSHSPH